MKWRLLIGIAILFLFGCEPVNTDPDPAVVSQNVMALQSMYFPMDVGHTWTYEISITDPGYTYSEQMWPVGDQSMGYAVTGFLHAESAKSYLTLQIKAHAEKQGPFSYPDGVLLDVVKDELSIYRDTKELYFNTTHDAGGMFAVQEVATYDTYAPGAPPMAMSDGYSVRMAFFSVKPDLFEYALLHSNENKLLMTVSLGTSPDTLGFMGFDSKVPGYENQPAMHFVREVVGNEATISFTTDLWFIKDKGLVRLEQKANIPGGMVWVLKTD